jgi:hypothetical protein
MPRKCDEYKPSRRSNAPMAPASRRHQPRMQIHNLEDIQMAKRSYVFGFEQFKVENCRSKGDHKDSDWLTVAVSTDQNVFPSQKLLLGDNLHAGDEMKQIYAGPFEIDDDALVTVTFFVVNLAHSAAEDQARQADQIAFGIGSAVAAVLASAGALGALATTAKANAILGALFGAVSGVLSGLAGLLGFTPSDPNCNGEILTRSFAFLPGELANRVAFTIGPTIPAETAKSPSECGNDPHSTVTYGVQRTTTPIAQVTSPDGVARVVYRGGVNHIHELRLPPGQRWFETDLTSFFHVPMNAKGDPFAYFTPWDSTARVAYRGTDNHINELFLAPHQPWVDVDLTTFFHVPMNAAGDPHGYITPWDSTARVVYRGTDNHIHELFLAPHQPWVDVDLTAVFTNPAFRTDAAGDPHGYITPWDNTARVVYRGADNHIRELFLVPGNPWVEDDITSFFHVPMNAAGNPFGYGTPSDRTARVVYSGLDNHIHELRLPPGQGWFDADLSALASA